MARIFITGSADGLGHLAAKSLADQGHRVVLHARNADRARHALQKVPGAEHVLAGERPPRRPFISLVPWIERAPLIIPDRQPNGRLEIIERAGHNPQAERTAETLAVIDSFLADIPRDDQAFNHVPVKARAGLSQAKTPAGYETMPA